MVSEEINPQQRAAIGHTVGPLRIMAGAGTGKTSTLKNRIVHLIEQGLAAPSEILALTFTNKAAGELRDRVGEAIASRLPGGERVDIDTYHAFGGRIVNEFGSVLGFPADPVVLSRAESWIILWRGVDEIGFEQIELSNLRGGLGKSPLAIILELGSRLSDEMQTVDALWRWLDDAGDDPANNTLRDYARALRFYERRKRELGAIDYGDQIVMACELLARPDVADTIGSRYTFIMVDEYQDTNYAQSVMVESITGGRHANVCVVGDPNQAIYAFRGAAPDNLDRFVSETFPGAHTQPLSDNYRSTQEILDLANSVWSESAENPYRGNLRSARATHGPRPLLIEAEHQDDELAFIARKILELHEAGRPFPEIAVITRKGNTKRQVFDTLRAWGIPAEIVGGQSLYETPEVREIISWLRAIGDPGHDTAFAYLLLSERCGMDERGLYDIALQRRKDESLQEFARRLVASGTAPDELTHFIATLSRLVQRSYAGLEPLFASIVDLRQGATDAIEAENIDRFSAVVTEFASSRLGSPDVQDLIAYLELLLVAGDEEEAATGFEPSESAGVTVITAHAAKGLQWPVVFVPCANVMDFYNQARRRTEYLPVALSHPQPGRPERGEFADDAKGTKAFEKALEAWQKAQARQEEYRTLYVALTRAEAELIVSWAKNCRSRSKETTIHPALEGASVYCQMQVAPPAQTVPAPVTLGSIAPQLVERLAPLFAETDATSAVSFCVEPGTVPADVRSRLTSIADEFGLGQEPFLEGWSQFERERGDMARQLAAFELVASVDSETPRTEDGIFFLSFTQIEHWERCPHQYYLRYVLGLPGEPRRWATQFGSNLHQAIAIEAERRMLGLPTTADDLRTSFARSAESVASEENRSAIDSLQAYFRSPDATAEVLLVEQPFTLRLGNVAISGIIDRVHRLSDGSTEVVDYKSSKHVSTFEEIRQGLQLPIYLMACQQLFPEIQPSPTRAVLFNLRHNVRTEVHWSPAELGGIRTWIITTASDMRRGDPDLHKASPDTCRWCDYRFNCRFSQYRG